MFSPRLRHKRNEAAWFDRAVDAHKDDLYTFARYYLRDEEDAADVTQDVLVRLWSHRRRVDPVNPGPWLRRVCRNACIDRLRKRTSRRRYEVHDDDAQLNAASMDSAPDAAAHNGQLHELVMARLEEMDEPFRTLIILREIQELPYAEIAAAMELPLNTVKVYLHRARRRLREALPQEIRNESV